jgi:hypothetical protein
MPSWIIGLLWALFGLLVLAAIWLVIICIVAGAWGLISYLRDPAAWREKQAQRGAGHYGGNPRLPVAPPKPIRRLHSDEDIQ